MITQSVTIEASGSGTTPQYSTAIELPLLAVADIAVVYASITAIGGGSSPTVTVIAQHSLDGVIWVDSPMTLSGSFSSTGAKAFGYADNMNSVLFLPFAKWLRFRATGGGTTAPTSWTCVSGFQVTKSDGAKRVIGEIGTITAVSVGTVKQVTPAIQLPPRSGRDRLSIALSLATLSGGTSPSVLPTIEGSVDGSNWLPLTLDADCGAAFTATGTRWVKNSQASVSLLSEILDLPWRYLRLTGTGGGTAAPTEWNLTATYCVVAG